MGGWLTLSSALLTGAVLVAAVSFYIYYGRLYMRARVAGGEISFRRMIGMTTSGLSAYRILTAFVETRRAGVAGTIDEFERCAQDGADPLLVSRRLIEANARGERISVQDAAEQIKGVSRGTAGAGHVA